MLLFPAIDLKDGKCVRLLRGNMASATIFDVDPLGRATSFADAGCSWLHMVDLDGAVEGRPVNRDAVAAILAGTRLNVQLGGGIRTIDTIAAWLTAGVHRCILGTVALREPALVREACKRWPGRIAVGIDARDGRVAVEGWTSQSSMKALDLAMRFEDVGVAAVIYTDIDRDGALGGVNVDATVILAQHLTTPVIASGGVSSIADLREIREYEREGIIGVIAGRALYDGRIDVAEAIGVLAQAAA